MCFISNEWCSSVATTSCRLSTQTSRSPPKTAPPSAASFAAQRRQDDVSRLKRVVLIGDHHQLPPVVQNMAIQKYSHLDQPLFTRFIRLGTPYVELNAQGLVVSALPGRGHALLLFQVLMLCIKTDTSNESKHTYTRTLPFVEPQGRARPSIAKLYNWRYRSLGDLPAVDLDPRFKAANPGLAFDYQFINVPNFLGKVWVLRGGGGDARGCKDTSGCVWLRASACPSFASGLFLPEMRAANFPAPLSTQPKKSCVTPCEVRI
eukprot:scaffold75140_cov19-Tisochrysis_lutea.AAC.2